MIQGITEILERPDVTLEEFLLNAAPAFAMFRRLDGRPLPEQFQPDTKYELKLLRESARDLVEARSWSSAQAQRAADESYAHQLMTAIEINRSATQKIDKLRAMRDQLAAWVAPSFRLRAYRDRLLVILDEAIINATPGNWSPTRTSGSSHRRRQIKQAKKEIRRAWKAYLAEIEYTKTANCWVSELRGSFVTQAA